MGILSLKGFFIKIKRLNNEIEVRIEVQLEDWEELISSFK